MIKLVQYPVLLFFIVAGYTKTYAQTDKLNQFWSEYAFTKDLSEKWVVELDGGLTSSSVPQDNNIFYGIIQVYIRGWVHYYPAERWKLSFFYAHYLNQNVPELDQDEAPEYRFAFQATYGLFKHRRINVNLRARIEDRNIKNKDLIFEAVERLRFQAKAVCPINGPKIDKNIIYAFVSDEVYFKTKSEVSGDEFFDRNRLTAGFGYLPTKDIQVEISYANEALPRETTNKVYNALQLNLTFNNLFTNALKPFKREKTAVDEAAPSGGGG